jgi:hypothetical protein
MSGSDVFGQLAQERRLRLGPDDLLDDLPGKFSTSVVCIVD